MMMMILIMTQVMMTESNEMENKKVTLIIQDEQKKEVQKVEVIIHPTQLNAFCDYMKEQTNWFHRPTEE